MIIKGSEVGDYRPTPLGSLQVQDFHVKVYSSGKFFVQYIYADLLRKLVNHLHGNIADDFDNVVVVDGIEGVGKSSFTWWLAELYQPGFDFEKQLTYTSEELRDKLRHGDDKHQVFWLDEAYDIANKREWQSDKNQIMIKNLVKMRSRHWTLLMDVPRLEDMDVYIREHRARYWITVEYGMVFDQLGPIERGVFHLRIRNRKTGHWEECGYGLFPDMPTGVKKIYKEYKERSQDKDLKEEEEDKSPGARWKKRYEDERKRLARTVLMLRNMGMPPSEIRSQLGLTEKQYYHLIEVANKTEDIETEDF